MNRKTIAAIFAPVSCALWLFGWGLTRAPRAALPNLVLITIDTLRPDHLECYGYKSVRTPRINSLADEGVLVENAYAPIPLTLPSHASLFTGTNPMFHGVRDFTGFTLSNERTTLAEMLKSAGYRTGAVVGSAVLEARWGLNQGFDFYYDNFSFSLHRDWQPIAERRGDVVVREALRWLEENKEGPFFLWAHLFDPHDPYEPPYPYDRQYRARPYDGEIAFTDDNVGRIIDYLKKNNLYEGTLIVLLADHGESLGEHGEKYHGFFIYDATLRIPMIFKLSGAAAPRGKRLAGPLNIIDVAPTVLQILGLAGRIQTPEIQGRGAYGAMLGKSSPGDLPAYAEIFLPFYHFEWSPLLSIRQGRYKFIDAPRPELYDTVADPGEAKNRYETERAVAGRLKDLLKQTTSRLSPANPAPGTPEDIDPATLEKLQSLGYLALSKGSPALPAVGNLPDPKDKIEIYELIRDGTRAAQEKDYDRAVRNLEEAVQREPGSLVGRFQLGNVFRVMGALDRAEREFQKVLQLRPDYTLALRRLGEIYLAGKRHAEAEAAYKKVLAQTPDDFLAHFNLGGLYVIQSRWDEALVSFRKAQGLNPGDAKIHVVVSRILLRQGDLAGALAAAQEALKLDPNMPEAHETSMEVYRRQGRSAEAEKEAQILQRLKAKP